MVKKICDILLGHLYDQYPKLLEKEIVGSCETLLDIGCGPSSPVRKFSSKLVYTVGVDCFKPYILQSRSLGIHNEYKIMNALEIGKYFKYKSFDCVLALDLIEHLSKEDGLKLILMMDGIARKKVIVVTPNGFIAQNEQDQNPYLVHMSGWKVEEMQKIGFRIIGINGWKPLRGELGTIKWRPSALWEGISLLTQVVTTKYPKYAFQILCIKDL